jgi:ornithine decarboxylase
MKPTASALARQALMTSPQCPVKGDVLYNESGGLVEPYLIDLIAHSHQRPTPAFWVSAQRIRDNYHRFLRGLPGARVFFPMKANPHPAVLRLLAAEGSSFDAASWGEISTLRRVGVPPARIAFTTPVKPLEDIRRAYRAGIECFVADCPMEVEKLAHAAPRSKVLVRLQTPNTGSQWPLSKRFGIEPHRAVPLFEMAGQRGLVPYGLTFHVGSQCTHIQSWSDAIRQCALVMENFERRTGKRLQVLNIGGGFPVRYLTEVPPIEAILADIRGTIENLSRGRALDVWVEPGRAVVGDAAVAATSVIGAATRARRNWLFCDLGAFNGLLELIEPSSRGFQYPVIAGSENGTRKRQYVLSGPSCDGDDVLSSAVYLPVVGLADRLYFLRTGAYSFAYGSAFCGNRRAAVHVV